MRLTAKLQPLPVSYILRVLEVMDSSAGKLLAQDAVTEYNLQNLTKHVKKVN